MVSDDCIQSRHEAALDALRDAILTGTIAPGAKLVQEELAQRFNMSRIPLREAFRTLEGEGLIVSVPRRGAWCRPLEAKDVDDLYTVRVTLERLTVRAAAVRYADVRDDTNRRSRSVARLRPGADPERFELDRAFHADIAAAAGNDHASRMLAELWSQITRAMYCYFKLEAYPQKVWDEHQQIAAAIAVGDPDRAERLMETHINNSREMILRGIREHAL